MKNHLVSLVVSCLLTLGALGQARAQAPDSTELIPVALVLRGVGQTELTVFTSGNTAYVPVTALFTFLKINTTYIPGQQRVEGYYITADSKYVLDASNRTATARGKVVALGPGDIRVQGTDLYMRADLYDQLFGLQLAYSARRLEIVLKTKEELPVFLERARELARKRKRGLYEVPQADYVAPRRLLPFSFGRLDYLLSSQISRSGTPRQTYSFHVGNQLLGGDFDGRVNGAVRTKLTARDATARLRYAFLTSSIVRQILIGDVFTGGLVPSSVWGAEITNRPAPRRYLFATEDIDGSIQTGGIADFYFRGTLSDYQKGDNDGSYSFSTPVTYGVSNYTVKQYDQYGVEREIEYRIIVPPTMLPPGQVEYSLVGGSLRFLDDKFYGDGTVQWGVNPYLTMGAGFDVYNGDNLYSSRRVHPFFTTTGRLTQLLTGDFVVSPTAYSRGILTVTYPSSAGASIDYTWYNRNPFYNPRNIRNDVNATVSIPIRESIHRLNLDLLARQTLFETGRDRVLQASIGGQFGIFSPRLTHRRTYRDREMYYDLEAYTSASLGVRASGGFFFRGTTRYYHNAGGFRDLQLEFSRRFTKEFWIQFFYNKSFITQGAIAGVQLVYYFPFALLRSIVSGGGSGLRTTESVSGSLGYSAEAGDFYLDYLGNRVGFGGILINPFVDANNNGIRDPGEEELEKAKIQASSMFGNQPLKYIPGSGFGLKHTLPYEEYTMTVDPEYFDNPLWIPKYNTISVISEPNQFRQIDLPIVFGGVIQGKVQGTVNGKTVPVEGITITLQSVAAEDGTVAYKKVGISFSTGEFEFIGVPPGKYKLSIEDSQIQILGYRTDQSSKSIEVISKPDGDEINDMNFELIK